MDTMKNDTLAVNRILLPYMGIMAGMCLVVQILTAIRGSHIDLISGLFLVPVAVYYAYFQYASKGKLSKVRFGRLVAHVIGFLIVNLSYHIHAAILLLMGKEELLGADWGGVLVAMLIFWGLGLLMHMTASVAMRGYEELDV